MRGSLLGASSPLLKNISLLYIATFQKEQVESKNAKQSYILLTRTILVQLIVLMIDIYFVPVLSTQQNINEYEGVAHLSGYNFTYASIKTLHNIPTVSLCAVECVDPDCVSFTFNKVDSVCQIFARRFLCANNVTRVNDIKYYVKKIPTKAIHHYEDNCDNLVPNPTECQDWHISCCKNVDGIYEIYPKGLKQTIYCLMDRGGWTVFQRRFDGLLSFNRDWIAYENGFGTVNGEYWLGNKIIHEWTSDGQFQMRVDMEDFEGNTSYIEYTHFALGDAASKYNLTAYGNSGPAQDSLAWHYGHKFSTFDQDNDITPGRHCGNEFQAGWWYVGCHSSNLNGLYLSGVITDANGMSWNGFTGLQYSLKSCSMSLRRGTF